MPRRDPDTDVAANPQDDYMATMRARYAADKAGWSVIREDFRQDVLFGSGDPADQWDPEIKQSRDDDGIPALTLDRLNPIVNQIVNQARKDRPQPKAVPGEGGDPDVAEAIEGKMRHALYESHADVAFDCAETYCALGGFGFYRMTKVWVKDSPPKRPGSRGHFIQEPRVERIPDPLTVLYDKDVQKTDYSDARHCFVLKKWDRKAFKRDFGKEPIPFDDCQGDFQDWGDESKVLVAEYWWIEEIPHRLVQLSDGTEDLADEIEFDEAEVINERQIIERVLHCDIVDGEKRLESTVWDTDNIPIYPVIAQERISDGVKRYVSAIRYSRDPQILINATGSGTADSVATRNLAPFIGPKGAFKDKKWRDGKRHFYLEYEVVNIAGQPATPPQRNAFEPAIQGTIAANVQAVDALKGAIGYVDAVTAPSQADLSGVAVEKRNDQQDLANFQYEDSLTESMWRFGRDFVKLLIALTDTPRVWDTRSVSGETSKVPVTMPLPDGTNPYAAGREGQPHLDIGDGDYGVVIDEGPSFARKQDEMAAEMEAIFKADPALMPIYLPEYFKLRGYASLAEIATAAQPPQIQQALAQAQGKGVPPQIVAQQAQALQAQNQHLTQLLHQAAEMLRTKQVETEGRLQVQNAKTAGELEKQRLELAGDIIKAIGDRAHETALHQSDKHHAAAGKMLDMFHAAELPHQAAALAPKPEPNLAPAG